MSQNLSSLQNNLLLLVKICNLDIINSETIRRFDCNLHIIKHLLPNHHKRSPEKRIGVLVAEVKLGSSKRLMLVFGLAVLAVRLFIFSKPILII